MRRLSNLDLICASIGIGIFAAVSGARAGDLSGFDCMIEPHSVVEISTREEGVLEEITVKRGDIVSRGQVVARLESGIEKLTLDFATARAEMQGDVQSRRATLDYLLRQRDRVEELYRDDAISFNEKDKAETDVQLARTELQIAKDNQRLMQIERERAAHRLDLRTIRSPVDGVIVEVLLEPGESVEDRAREIVRIAEVDPLNIEVILPANLFGAVHVGTPAEVTPLITGGEVQVTNITVVDRTIDAASETFGVQLQLENSEHQIPGGIRCDIKFMPDTEHDAPSSG